MDELYVSREFHMWGGGGGGGGEEILNLIFFGTQYSSLHV